MLPGSVTVNRVDRGSLLDPLLLHASLLHAPRTFSPSPDLQQIPTNTNPGRQNQDSDVVKEFVVVVSTGKAFVLQPCMQFLC